MPSPLSTIYVDTREKERPHPSNSSRTTGTDMLTLLRSHRSSPHCEPAFLAAGDFCFSGNGPGGPIMIGIERKRPKDMLNSMRSGRLSGEQLPKLFNHYDYRFLVLEGILRINPHSGILEERWGRQWAPVVIGKQTFVGLELYSYLNTLAICTPLRIHLTATPQDTCEYVLSLHHSFSKPWDKHHSHIAIHRPEEYATLGKASTVRRVAFDLHGVGWERSGEIDKHFHSVAEMTHLHCPHIEECQTKPKDFAKLDGFGKVLSKRVCDQLHGLYDPDQME